MSIQNLANVMLSCILKGFLCGICGKGVGVLLSITFTIIDVLLTALMLKQPYIVLIHAMLFSVF